MLFLVKLSYRRDAGTPLRHGQITLLIPAGDVSEVADIVEQLLKGEPEVRESSAREFFADDLIEIDPEQIPPGGVTLKVALYEADQPSGLYLYGSGPGCTAYSTSDPLSQTEEEPYLTLE
jgi:hypothetical protein